MMKFKPMLIIAALIFLAGQLPIRADVIVKSTLESKDVSGMMSMQGTQEVMVSGDKSKSISNLKMTNKVMKFMGAGKPQESAEITRLDKELFWNLDLKEKKYEEQTFAEFRAEAQKALDKLDKEKAKELKDHPQDSLQMHAEVHVNKTGKTQKIAGYNTEQTVVTMLIMGKNSESGETGKLKFEMDIWLARDVPGTDEFNNFYKSLGEKLGIYGHNQQGMQDALIAMGIDPQEIYDKMGTLEGMPLMTSTLVTMEGDSAAAARAKMSKETDTTSEETQEATKEEKPKGLGALKKKVFGGQKEEKKEDSKKGSEQAGTMPILLRFSSTVTEISGAAIPGSEFEVPAGFQKK